MNVFVIKYLMNEELNKKVWQLDIYLDNKVNEAHEGDGNNKAKSLKLKRV